MKLRAEALRGINLYMVGIKGAGMSALAELLALQGAEISGSDVSEIFYTDEILRRNNISVFQGFNAEQVPEKTDLVLYSSAYELHTHPELLRARDLGHTCLSYPEALAQYADSLSFAAVAGVHGKTTTTAMIALCTRELHLGGQVLAGAALCNLGGSASYNGGNEFFVAESCEYRRNFLKFTPRHLLVTSIEADHLDYFKDENDVFLAFEEFLSRVSEEGSLVYCFDDSGARRLAQSVCPECSHPDINQERRKKTTATNTHIDGKRIFLIPYGFQAPGDYGITSHYIESSCQYFTLRGFNNIKFKLCWPGRHSVLNATAALALLANITDNLGNEIFHHRMGDALKHFSGVNRRSEIVADLNGIRIMDDYAHHPTAIRNTLAGYRDFFPGRRLIVNFMPHTFSRTSALLEKFASCFTDADIVILNDIYASARETKTNAISVKGRTLYDAVRRFHSNVYYIEDFEQTAYWAYGLLKECDIFVTMGAGNNWLIGRRLADILRSGNDL